MNKLEFQNEIVSRINVSYESDKISHAYIFSGVRNSGQIEVAKYLASKVLEADEEEKHLINLLSHPDIFYITSEKQNIGKDQVVEMSYEISTTSMDGKRKIFIIDDAQKLSISAQNSLLKVVEEPDGDSIVIFIVENLNQLLTTVVSRSQIVKFKPVNFELLYSELVSQYEDTLKLKYALYLENNTYDELYDSEEFTKYLDVVHDYLELYFTDRNSLLMKLEEICYSFCNNKEKMTNFINLLIVNVSSIINYKNNTGELFDPRISSLVEYSSLEELIDLQNKLFESYDMIKSNVNVRLAVDKMSMERI